MARRYSAQTGETTRSLVDLAELLLGDSYGNEGLAAVALQEAGIPFHEYSPHRDPNDDDE